MDWLKIISGLKQIIGKFSKEDFLKFCEFLYDLVVRK